LALPANIREKMSPHISVFRETEIVFSLLILETQTHRTQSIRKAIWQFRKHSSAIYNCFLVINCSITDKNRTQIIYGLFWLIKKVHFDSLFHNIIFCISFDHLSVHAIISFFSANIATKMVSVFSRYLQLMFL